MVVARRAMHTTRPGFERQEIECRGCGHATLRSVKEAAPPR